MQFKKKNSIKRITSSISLVLQQFFLFGFPMQFKKKLDRKHYYYY
jgi:hypothetical protein